MLEDEAVGDGPGDLLVLGVEAGDGLELVPLPVVSPYARELTFLGDLDRYVSEACERLETDRADNRFHRLEIAEATDWSYNQVRKDLERLVELEYVLVHRGSRGQSFVFELLWQGEGDGGERFAMRLIDVEALRTAQGLTPEPGGLTSSAGESDPSLVPHLPAIDPRLTPGRNAENVGNDGANRQIEPTSPQNALLGDAQLELEAPYLLAARGRDG